MLPRFAQEEGSNTGIQCANQGPQGVTMQELQKTPRTAFFSSCEKLKRTVISQVKTFSYSGIMDHPDHPHSFIARPNLDLACF